MGRIITNRVKPRSGEQEAETGAFRAIGTCGNLAWRGLAGGAHGRGGQPAFDGFSLSSMLCFVIWRAEGVTVFTAPHSPSQAARGGPLALRGTRCVRPAPLRPPSRPHFFARSFHLVLCPPNLRQGRSASLRQHQPSRRSSSIAWASGDARLANEARGRVICSQRKTTNKTGLRTPGLSTDHRPGPDPSRRRCGRRCSPAGHSSDCRCPRCPRRIRRR